MLVCVCVYDVLIWVYFFALLLDYYLVTIGSSKEIYPRNQICEINQ